MARKNKRSKPDPDGILRTGIFQRDCRPPRRESLTKSLKRMQELALNPPPRPTIQQWLDQHVAYFAEILRPHVSGTGDGHALDMGEGWKFYRRTDTAPEECQDAIQGMDAVRLFQQHLAADGSLDGDLAIVIQCAFDLGRIVQRIQVRPFEPAAKSGLNKSRKAKINAISTNRKRAANRPDYAAAVKGQMDQGVKYDPACQVVAHEYDVTKETVRNNTPELRPRRPKQK